MTRKEIKQREDKVKLKVRKGDFVKIISGKDKGQEGFIAQVLPNRQKVIVLQANEENPDQPLPLNAAIKHRKARTQAEKSARIKIPVPIHISNVMVIDPKTSEPTRVGRKVQDGKLIRYAKKSGEAIPNEPVMEKE